VDAARGGHKVFGILTLQASVAAETVGRDMDRKRLCGATATRTHRTPGEGGEQPRRVVGVEL
jgi:hypothetical protein